MASAATLSNIVVQSSTDTTTVAPTSAAGGGTTTTTTTTAATSGNVERRCENADCNVIKLVSMVPKRKITQFVTEPKVMEKPMLINGFTTVFQVDGTSAKLSDLKNPSNAPVTQPKTIFRIVPNTHAHIVNYVVVDADGESLRKINESDPATMRKLLESQKVSADQMLKKLMAGHGCSAPATVSVPVVPATTASNTSRSVISSTQVTITPIVPPSNVSTTVRTTSASLNSSTTISKTASTNSAIQLPLRMHPNLKITAVASRDTISSLGGAAGVSLEPTVPLITPVPLANLQSTPTSVPTPPPPASISAPPVAGTMDKTNIDKMQAELAELRRTVAMLAEAMPKNQQNPQVANIQKSIAAQKLIIPSSANVKRVRLN